MAVNPSPGFTPQGDPYRDLGLGGSRSSVLIEVANGEDPLARRTVRDLIHCRPDNLPREFLEEAAFAVRYSSIAQALLLTVDRMSYVARKALASHFERIGRDDGVLQCLASSNVHDAEGLRMICDAARRSRFVAEASVDLEATLFAASFADARAEVSWIQLFSRQERKGRDLDRTVHRLIDLAEQEKNPHAYNALGEMLLNEDLTASKPGVPELCFRNAAHVGLSPAKLNVLKHCADSGEVGAHRYLADFYNDSYFPGLAWCHTRLRSEDGPLRQIDIILRQYLWHPDYPIGSSEEVAQAKRSAEELSGADSVFVAQWARRNGILVIDERYPSVCSA